MAGYFGRKLVDLYGPMNVRVPRAAYLPATITNPLTNEPLVVYNQDPLTKGLNDRRRLLEVVSSIVLVTLDDDVGEHPIAEVGADVTDDQISAGV